jgi:aerobic-type carbon monoxide dehydrogenase small subunit (CoxS/CutS family)
MAALQLLSTGPRVVEGAFQYLRFSIPTGLASAELNSGQTGHKKSPAMKETINFKLNGKPTKLEVEGDRMLLWVLRTDLELTGTKFGCGESHCGACTVVIGKEAVRSCVFPIKEVRGKEVTTIEGLARNGNLHPLQKAFAELGALQCGFCTPGMIMNAYALLLKNPKPTRDQIIMGMQDNLCRCAAHKRIVQAIENVSKKM